MSQADDAEGQLSCVSVGFTSVGWWMLAGATVPVGSAYWVAYEVSLCLTLFSVPDDTVKVK